MMTLTDEALVCLAEECGELTQAAMKIVRFGTSDDALKQLTQEAGDVLCLLGWLHSNNLISWDDIELAAENKKKKLTVFSNLYGRTKPE